MDEIKQHLTSGATGDMCVHREILFPEMPHKVKSIYITGGYAIVVEFDDVNAVNSSDGWKWRSSTFTLPAVITVLERFLGKKVDDWRRVSECALLAGCDEQFDAELISEEEQTFKNVFNYGQPLLPILLGGVHWEISPFGMKKKNLTTNFQAYLDRLEQRYCKLHLPASDDLAFVITILSSVVNGRIDNTIIETECLRIEIYKGHFIGQGLCVEIYPLNWACDDHALFTKSVKKLMEALKKKGIYVEIEIN